MLWSSLVFYSTCPSSRDTATVQLVLHSSFFYYFSNARHSRYDLRWSFIPHVIPQEIWLQCNWFYIPLRIDYCTMVYPCRRFYQTCRTRGGIHTHRRAKVSSAWFPWNLSFSYIVFYEKRLQMMLWHHNAKSIHTKDESKRGSAFAFIFGVNWPVQWM